MEYKTILYETNQNVVTMTLNRPEKLNSLSRMMKDELVEAISHAISDDEIRVIVLTGNGRAFSAGNDLKEGYGTTKGLEKWRKRLEREILFVSKFWDCPKPIIAAVNGPCLAIACEIAMACDITIAAESATFGEPEIRLSSGPPILITPWVLGLKRAKQLLLTGDTIDAKKAEQYGMVNIVVPSGRLMDEALCLARRIAKIPPYAVQVSKQTINRCFEIMGFKNALLSNAELMAINNFIETPERTYFSTLIKEKGLKEMQKAVAARYGTDS